MLFITVPKDGKEQLVKIVKKDMANEHFLKVCIIEV
jgi:hypothetical protein